MGAQGESHAEFAPLKTRSADPEAVRSPTIPLCCVRRGVITNFARFFFFTELNKNPVEGFSAGLIDDNDIYRWEVLIIGPPDTL